MSSYLSYDYWFPKKPAPAPGPSTPPTNVSPPPQSNSNVVTTPGIPASIPVSPQSSVATIPTNSGVLSSTGNSGLFSTIGSYIWTQSPQKNFKNENEKNVCQQLKAPFLPCYLSFVELKNLLTHSIGPNEAEKIRETLRRINIERVQDDYTSLKLLTSENIQTISKLKTVFTATDLNTIFENPSTPSLKKECSTLITETTLCLTHLEETVKKNQLINLQFLLDAFSSYPNYQQISATKDSVAILERVIKEKSITISFNETNTIKKGLSLLKEHYPTDQFFEELYNYLNIDTLSIRQQASTALSTLAKELADLDEVAVREKINHLNENYFLPEPVLNYFYIVYPPSTFEPLLLKSEQSQAIFELTTLFRQIVDETAPFDSSELKDHIGRVALLILHPEDFSKEKVFKEKEKQMGTLEKLKTLHKINTLLNSNSSPSTPSTGSSLDKTLLVLEKANPLFPILKELIPILERITKDDGKTSAVDKVDKIVDKMEGFKDIFSGLIPLLKQLTKESNSESSIDKIKQVVINLQPFKEPFEKLIPLLTKLATDQQPQGPTGIDKTQKIIDSITPHAQMITNLIGVMNKLLEDKVTNEPTSVDKVLQIVKEITPLISILEPYLKKFTKDADPGQTSVIDQTLKLVDKITVLTVTLNPVLKAFTEKPTSPTSLERVETILDKVSPIVKTIVPLLNALSDSSNNSNPKAPSSLAKAEAILDKFIPIFDKLYPILQQMTAESKQPSSLQRLGELLDKASSMITTLDPLIKKFSEPTLPTKPGDSYFDKADKILDKLVPITKTTSELISLISRLTTAVPTSNTSEPSSMEKIDGMITKLNELATKLNVWLPIVQKLSEPSSEPSSLDKANSALDKLNKAVEGCTKMLESVMGVFSHKKSSGSSPAPTPLKKLAEALHLLLNTTSSVEQIQKAKNELATILNTVPTEELGKGSWDTPEKAALVEAHQELERSLQSRSLDEQARQKIEKLLNQTLSPYLTTPLEKIFSNVADILARMASNSASKAGNMIASQMGSQLAAGLNLILGEAKRRIEGLTPTPTYQPLIQAIDVLNEKIEIAKKDGSWKELYQAFQEFRSNAKSLPPLAINGMMFSLGDEKASSLEKSPFTEALILKPNTPKPPLSQENYKALQKTTDLQREDFARSTANFLVIKNVYETICGITPSDPNFYTQLMNEARDATKNNPKQFENVLHAKFYAKIDEAYKDGKILLITKWFSKLFFMVTIAHARSWVNKISSRFIEHVRTAIIQKNEQTFDQFKNSIVENFNSYLGGLGDAFEHALSKDSAHSHLNAKVENELKKPSYNHGYSPEQLYAEAAKKAVETFMADVSWTASIKDWFTTRRLDDTYFLQRCINEFGNLASVTMRIFVWLPQKAINLMFTRRLKQWLVKSDGINILVNKSIDSLIDKNGYTHALNCVIRDQLIQILDYLKNEKGESKNQDNKPSEHQKTELTRLVSGLLEVLDKSRCMTSGQLKKFMENKTPQQKLQESLDEFLIPNVVDSTVKVINATYQSAMNKEQLEKQLCNFMSLVNKSYEPGKDIDEAEFKRTEREITQLTDRILEVIIDDAIKTKFDFLVDGQTKVVNSFIEKLQKDLKVYVNELQPQLDELGRKFSQNDCSGSKILLEKIKDRYSAFIGEYDQKFFFEIASNNDISADMKNHLKILSENAVKHCKLFRDPMYQLSEMEEKIFRGEKVANDKNLEKELLHQMQQGKNALFSFAESDQFKPIVPMQFSFAQWNWFMDFVKNIAHKRIKERVDSLIKFLRLPYNYRYGIFHHGLLIPFVGRKKNIPTK